MKKTKVNKKKLWIRIILGLVFISVALVSVSFRMQGDDATADTILTSIFGVYATLYFISTYFYLKNN
jgi:flagellar basal body-associated protein FliL